MKVGSSQEEEAEPSFHLTSLISKLLQLECYL